MRILLIHPSNLKVYEKMDKKGSKTPPIGIMYLAGVLRKNGYNVEILDAEADSLTLDQTVSSSLKHDPDLIGITCTTPLIESATEISKKIKEQKPGTVTVLGGPHITALPQETLEQPSIDYIVCGEGELTLLELVQALERSKPVETIRGIGFKRGRESIINPPRQLIEDLNSLPFPARDLVPKERYVHMVFGPREPFTVIVSSRGCPFQCIFCASNITFGKRARFRTPTNVADEIEDAMHRLNIARFVFSDDTFTLNKRRTIEICKEIMRRRLDISFVCSSRVDTIDEERLRYLKKAGCFMVTYGVESGDDGILNKIKKGITVSQSRRAIELTRKYGLKTIASYMIGNVGETRETVEKTLKLAGLLKTDVAQFSIATPFPGTEFWRIAKEEGRIRPVEFSDYGWYYKVVYDHESLDPAELVEFQKLAYKLYSTPLYKES